MNEDPIIEVFIDEQRLDMSGPEGLIASYPVSTAAKGVGFTEGSFRTPTGRFRIAEKVGANEPVGTIFRGRIPCGRWEGEPVADDLILTRILRISGIDPENANTLERCIYIHGTNREDLIGQPASHGCIRMQTADLIDLFDRVPVGALMVIHPPVQPRGRLIFLDCDSTLSAIEGIDELARVRGAGIFAEVAALTDAAMNGEIPLDQVFGRRMQVICPTRAMADEVAMRYVERMVPGMDRWVAILKQEGWVPVILSGGFAPLIEPLARVLGIDHVEAVPLHFDASGGYAGFGEDFPTTRNGGKNEVIREWRQAMLPERVVMVGDGVSDLETKEDVDLFVGFGAVVARERVKDGADIWLPEMREPEALMEMINRAFRPLI